MLSSFMGHYSWERASEHGYLVWPLAFRQKILGLNPITAPKSCEVYPGLSILQLVASLPRHLLGHNVHNWYGPPYGLGSVSPLTAKWQATSPAESNLRVTSTQLGWVFNDQTWSWIALASHEWVWQLYVDLADNLLRQPFPTKGPNDWVGGWVRHQHRPQPGDTNNNLSTRHHHSDHNSTKTPNSILSLIEFTHTQST